MVRRSNRTTKGQHSQRSTQPAYVYIPGETVRCLVCGSTDADYDEDKDDGEMIECESCTTWQHIQCMFPGNAKIPENYRCDVCDPDNWMGLDRKLSYRMYIERNGVDTSGINDEDVNVGNHVDDDDDADDYGDDGMEEDDAGIEEMEFRSKRVKTDGLKTSVRKRKNPTISPSVISLEPVSAAVPMKEAIAEVKAPVVDRKVEALRSSIRRSFENKLKVLLPDTMIEEASEWAVKIEEGLFSKSGDYKDNARRLLINLTTSKLVDRVLNGEFKIDDLGKLSNDEMRTKEQREKDEEAKRRAIDQVVLKQDDSGLVKTRVTHRGVEIVGEEEFRFNVEDKRAEEVEKLRDERDDADLYGEYEESHEDENNEGQHDLLDDDDFDNILKDNKNKKKKETIERVEEEYEPEYEPESLSSTKSSTSSITETSNIIVNTLDRDFSCEVKFISSTSTGHKRNQQIIRDMGDKITTKGRINTTSVDSYLEKVTISRDIYIYQVLGDTNGIWNGYYSISRYGVIDMRKDYVKDCYLVCLNKEKIVDGEEGSMMFSKIDKGDILTHLENTVDDKLVYIVYVVKR